MLLAPAHLLLLHNEYQLLYCRTTAPNPYHWCYPARTLPVRPFFAVRASHSLHDESLVESSCLSAASELVVIPYHALLVCVGVGDDDGGCGGERHVDMGLAVVDE